MSIPSYSSINTDGALAPGLHSVDYPNTYIETGDANETIPFGYGVYEDTDGVVKIVTEAELSQYSARNSFGVAMFSARASALSSGSYSQYDKMGVGKTGIFTVVTNEQVTRGDVVRLQVEADTGKPVGTFCKTGQIGKSAIINGARWINADSATSASVFLPDSVTFTAD